MDRLRLVFDKVDDLSVLFLNVVLLNNKDLSQKLLPPTSNIHDTWMNH